MPDSLIAILAAAGAIGAGVVAVSLAPTLARRAARAAVRRDLQETPPDQLIARTEARLAELKAKYDAVRRAPGATAAIGGGAAQVAIANELKRIRIYRAELAAALGRVPPR